MPAIKLVRHTVSNLADSGRPGNNRKVMPSMGHKAAQQRLHDNAIDRQTAVEERAEERAARTDEQQLATLDSRLGANMGARKERRRLNVCIARSGNKQAIATPTTRKGKKRR